MRALFVKDSDSYEKVPFDSVFRFCRGGSLRCADRHGGGFQREDAARNSGAGRGSRCRRRAAHARALPAAWFRRFVHDVAEHHRPASAGRRLRDDRRLPDGANSWYWDSPLDPASQFETFVAQELPDWIDARYLTIPSREGRAVTGLSMGGHGALWVALRHKDRFGAAGSTSGAWTSGLSPTRGR